MVRCFIILMMLLSIMPALAQEPVGCDKFKWPLAQERALLAKPARIVSGAAMPHPLQTAVKLALMPFREAKLPVAPSHRPKLANFYAGFLQVAAVAKAGIYRITLSHPAWIDVIQSGRILKSSGFTGAAGCDGLAKSVTFDLAAAPFIIEISGSAARESALVVTGD
ncbi:hypothetical protein MHY1_p00085 (plasmid) [Methylovirgula sp. HY1]|nr:hypothetical protein MHY1_p00085 [Methylovirgula sp. HY1]